MEARDCRDSPWMPSYVELPGSCVRMVVQRVPMIVKDPISVNTFRRVMVICSIVETEATPAT